MAQHIKQREIHFSCLHPDHHSDKQGQAHSSALLLLGIPGIHKVEALSPTCLFVQYDLHQVSLCLIEDALIEVGYHLDNSLLVKLKRALYHYSEETERINLGCCESQKKTTREVHIKQYQIREHGCRDERPAHWRTYL